MSSNNFIPQFIPYCDEKEKNAVMDVLNSGYLNEHKLTREFERKFAEFVGAKYCITCNNGTQSLYLAILATRNHYVVKTQDFMKVPDFHGIFVNNACVQAGLQTYPVDVDLNGSCDDYMGGTFVVHANGRLGGTIMLEDCCQAIDHHTKNKISCYSFASTKHLTTAGQGGAVCCDDKDIFDKLSRLKDHGRNDRQQLKPMSDNFAQWGFNAKFTEVQAAFGLAQLEKLPRRLETLKKMYSFVQDALGSSVKFLEGTPKWYIDIMTPDPHILIDRLAKKGIQARRFPKPLHDQPIFESKKNSLGEFVNSKNLYDHGIYLPSTTNLTEHELHYVCESVKESLAWCPACQM